MCHPRKSLFPAREIELFCVCLMPETCGDMIECDNCSNWLHMNCVNLSFLPGEMDIWHCLNCVYLTNSTAVMMYHNPINTINDVINLLVVNGYRSPFSP